MAAPLKRTRVLIIGLDGATWKLLDPWIKDGKLPWFATVKRRWFTETLHSTLPPLTGSSWMSFQTGVNPGKHGILDFIHYRKDKLFSLVSSEDNSYPTIWRWLEDSGKKSIIINMPMTYPIQKGNSVVVSSLMTPPGKQYASPNSVYKRLKSLGYQVDLEKMTFGIPEESMKNRDQIYRQALRMADKRAEAALRLLELEWDFFFVLFKSTDITQHLFWNGPETVKLYHRLERHIRRIIRKAEKRNPGQDLLVIIASDHGFHKGETISFGLYEWLKRGGFLEEKKPARYHALRKAYQVVRFFAPRNKTGSILEKTRKHLTKKEGNDLVALTRRRAKAWPVPFGIYLNDSSILHLLKRKLEKIRYRKKHVLQKVLLKEEIYEGENLPVIPDLIFLPEPWVKIEANPIQNSLWKKKKGYLAGNHNADPNGIIAMKLTGNMTLTKKNRLEIVDIFPTIMEALDQPCPQYCDGTSLIIKQNGRAQAAEKKRVKHLISEQLEKLGWEENG